MSDAMQSRASTPFPAEGSVTPAPIDPLAGDWSEGLRGSVRALGIPEPKLLALDGDVAQAAVAATPVALPVAEEVEAPDAWGASSEDPLQSAPPPAAASDPPSVIITFSEPPEAEPETAVALDLTPPSPAPAFLPDVTPASPAPSFVADLTPESAAPAFTAEPATPAPAEAVVELGAEDAAPAEESAPAEDAAPAANASPAEDAAPAENAGPVENAAPAGDGPAARAEPPTPWSEPVAAGAPTAAASPWAAAPLPLPGPQHEAASWDQVTAVTQAPAVVPPSQWQMHAPQRVAEWKAEAPASDWEAVKQTAVEVPAEASAADWGTLSKGPDWSASAPQAAPADEAWGSAPPPAVESAWTAAPAPSTTEWSAAEPAGAWAPAAPPAPAASWHSAPVGATALEQLETAPEEVEAVPGAAKDLFGSVPAGASLAEDQAAEDLRSPEDLQSPEESLEELQSPEEVLKPVELLDDDADLPVPVDEEPRQKEREEKAPALPAPFPAKALGLLQPVSPLAIPGEHRVAVHTRGGRTRRGTLKDPDLAKAQFSLLPQGGGEPEPVYHAEVKAIFFMLAPGEKPVPGDGAKVRVTFADGRTIEGNRDGAEAKHGFFLVPSDAARTNTRRIYVAREATTEIKDP